MTLENYGSVWQSDHCVPIASFNLLDENEMKKSFNWINLRPMYSNENNLKKAKLASIFTTRGESLSIFKIKWSRKIILKLFLTKYILNHPRKIIQQLR